MPELPEVETIRRGLAERLPGQTITGVRVRRAPLRHLVDVAALQEQAVGRTITSVDRRAKYLLVRLQPDGVLVLYGWATSRAGLALLGAPAHP
jgi:formamidopyrimidine-DNA glycosylase